MNDLCIATCYYNPEAYRTKLHNYLLFEKALRTSGLQLVTVECSMGQTDFELPDRPGLVRLRGRDVMWQKERLLNVAIENVPERFTKIAWLDCDLLFTNENWAEETSRLLDRYPVVQPFETAVRLPRGATSDASGGEHSGGEHSGGEQWTSFGAAYARRPHALLSGDFVEHGHTGFAWAARREILSSHGLYDGCVAGSGDHMMAHAFAGDWHGRCIRRIFGDNQAHWRHFAAWSKSIYRDVRAAVSYVPGSLLHLWHGETQDRRYVHRNRDLAGFLFDPARDVAVGSSGCWEWSSEKPALHRWAENYSDYGTKTGNARRQRLVEDSIQDVVERIERYADRELHAGDQAGEQEARDAALRAQNAMSIDEALRIEAALQEVDDPVIPGQEVVKKKRGWLQRLLGWGDDDTDNS